MDILGIPDGFLWPCGIKEDVAWNQSAWWEFDSGTLKKLAGGLKLKMDANMTLMDMLVAMSKQVLHISEEGP